MYQNLYSYKQPIFDSSDSPKNFFNTTVGKIAIIVIIILVLLGLIGLTIFFTHPKKI